MVSDEVIVLRPMAEEELEGAHALSETEEARDFLLPVSLERFQADYSRTGIVYLSIVEREPAPVETKTPAGYFILVLEPDGASVECRRVVVGPKNRGIGKRAMTLLDRYCRDHLDRRRIWLDVYDFNERGRCVYESCGYRYTGQAERDGKTLWFYEKHL